MDISAQRRRYLPAVWIFMTAVILAVNFLAGPMIGVSTMLIFPVALAAHFSGRGWGVTLAVVGPLIRLSFHFFWTAPLPWRSSVINEVIRIGVLVSFALLIARVARQERENRVLRGLLPICSFCKKIRTPEKQWQPMEMYISANSEATFTHGFCPDCAREHYGVALDEDQP